MADILLVGAGGHCRACIDVIEAGKQFAVRGVVVSPGSPLTPVFGHPAIGTDLDLQELVKDAPDALVTVGQIQTAGIRKRLFALLKSAGARLAIVVSPSAYVSSRANIAEGSIIMHSAVVNAGASVGRNAIVNTMALIEHDVLLGDHCHVATGARLNGGVQVGDAVFVGSGAVIREGVRIGAGAIIGAGSLVLHDVPEGALVKARR